jgi:phosphohistidine swiveling domain-containing protein
LPVIVGAQDAVKSLLDGALVTVDPVSGVVYEGEISL